MPYKPSAASMDMISRLRSMLNGGGGNDPVAGLLGQSGNPSLTGLGTIAQSKPSSSNFLADVLGRGPISGDLSNLGGQDAPQPQQQTPQDYVEEFLKSMAASIGGGSGLNSADYEEALKNSAAQIKGAFGAEIGAVKASSANARHQSKRSKKQIKAMYNALGRQYDKAAGAEVAQGKDIANALQGVATTASGQVKGTSDQLLNEQAALAKGLGVQSALPEVTAKQTANTAKQVGNIQQYGAQQAGDQLSNSGSQQRYLVRGGKNALLEGTNQRADLVQQLQAFLQQNMGKIADIKGQRGQALAANTASVTKSFGDASNQAGQDTWNKQKDMAQLLLSLRGQNSKSGASSALPKFAQQSSQILGGTSDPQGIGSVIEGLMGTKEVTRGKFQAKDNQTYNMSAGKFADEVARALRAQGVSEQDISLAKLAAIAQYQGIY
jgi:hypothetical protein